MMDPRFMGPVPDMGQVAGAPTKAEQQRLAAVSVAQNLCMAPNHSGNGAVVQLDTDPAKAGTQFVGLAKVVAKYLDTGN